MEQSDLLRTCVEALERLSIPYFVTGSMATIYYGEPRFTNDVDFVIRMPMERLMPLCRHFALPEFYLSDDAVRAAVETFGQFNVIHPASGLKADFMVAADSDFNRSRFSRRRLVSPAADYQASFASPEDVILMKLVYHQRGGSDKHLRDIAGVLHISGGAIDHAYVSKWVVTLGVADLWNELVNREAD